MTKILPSRKGENSFNNRLPIGEAADFLGVSIDTLRRWDRKGVLKSTRFKGKDRYFALEDLEKIKLSKPIGIGDAAKRLGVSSSTLRRLEKKDLISPSRDKNNERVYSYEVLEKFLAGKYSKKNYGPDKLLGPLKEKQRSTGDNNKSVEEEVRGLGESLAEDERSLHKLTKFRKAIYSSGTFLVTTFLLLVSIITILFLSFPEATGEYFGYKKTIPLSWKGGGSRVLGVSDISTPGASLLKPVSSVSLSIVKLVNEETYNKIVPSLVIEDVNQIFELGLGGSLVPYLPVKFPSSDYLEVSTDELVDNLNTEFVQGKAPGTNLGDLVYWGGTGTVSGLTVTSTNLASGSVTGGVGGVILDASIVTEDIKDGSVTSAKLATGVGGTPNDDSVTSAKIDDGTITNSDIAGNTISTGQLSGTLTFADGDILDLSAIDHSNISNQGLLLPNVSSDTPSSPASGEGFLAYDTAGDQLVFYDGSNWTTVSGGGGGSIKAQEGDTTVSASTTTFDYLAADFILSESPSNEVNISIDYPNSGITRVGQDETVTGAWTFSSATPLALSSTTPSISIGNTGTLSITDGTNTLASLVDDGTTGTLNVNTLSLSGTGTLEGLDSIDSTSETTLEAALDVAGDITGTGLSSITIDANTIDDSELVDSLAYTGTLTASGTLNASGTFQVGGVTVSASAVELNINTSGIALSELTDSGTLTATTVDINGGAIDGTTVGSSSATTGAFTTLSASGDITFSATTPNIAITDTESLTITDGTSTLFTLADDGTTATLSVNTLTLTETGTLNGLDSIDSTSESTIEAAIDTLANLTAATSLVTIGTIGTGVWEGTAINATYLDGQSGTNTGDESAADLTTAGVVELATGAETNTGTDATRAVTPDGLDDWTGSAQLTTLGTIGTGVWQGTVVDIAYLDANTVADDTTEAITGVWEIQDDTNFVFGNDANWAIEYDEGVDDQLLFTTTGTAATVTTDPLFEILVGTTPTADQQVFGIAKGSQATNTALFTIDEDGDLAALGDITVAGGDIVLGTTSIFSGGDTASLNNVDAIDGTTETTLEAALDVAGDITGTGLSSITIDANVIDDSELVDALTYTGTLTASGTFNASGTLQIGGVAVTASAAEINVVNGGIALSELTDSGTLTATTVDINGGAIDGTTIGASSATTGAFTTLSVSGDITFSATTPNIAITNTESLTITDGTNTLFTLADDGTTATLSVNTLTLTGTGTLNGLDLLDSTSETTIEAAIDTLGNLTSASSLMTVGTIGTGVWQGTVVDATYLDANAVMDDTAEVITGVWEVQDDTNFVFGNDANWTIEYDEGVDNQLLFTTTGTAATTTTDPLFEILVGTTPTADQQVFGISKGSQATNTELFTIDEDGDVVITGSLSVSDSNITNVGDIALDTISADDGSSFTISSNWTNAGNTIADLGIVTTVDVNGGTVDGATIGAASATTIIGTTIDATTDFTIGGTVITDNTITDDGTLIIASTTATSFSDGAITNVGDIALDSLTSDAGAAITITPTTDTIFSDGTGVVIGHTAQLSIGSTTPEVQVLGTAGADSFISLGRWQDTVTGPKFIFVKSRNAAIGTNTIVQDGDSLGNITFLGDDGVDYDSVGASIQANVDGTPGIGDMPTRLVFSTTADGAESVTERMRIDSAGNVFIGETDNANATLGLTINQGANDNEIFALKSSDVAHGMTDLGETDTFGLFKKPDGASGGLQIRGLRDADGAAGEALLLWGSIAETADTTKSAAATGVVSIWSGVIAGTGETVLGADGNILAIGSGTEARFVFDAEGTIHQIPGSDTDLDLLNVQVTGDPTISWDEDPGEFDISHNLEVVGGTITITAVGAHANFDLVAGAAKDPAITFYNSTTKRGKYFYDQSQARFEIDAYNVSSVNRIRMVDGTDDIEGDGTWQGTAFGPSEWVIGTGSQGDVVCSTGSRIDEDGERRAVVEPCDEENSKHVMGVIIPDDESPQHGNAKFAYKDKLFDEFGMKGVEFRAHWAETHVAVELTGFRPTNVIGPVAVGDFLISSTTLGHAIATKKPGVGAILGKAVEEYTGSEPGVILARIHLQSGLPEELYASINLSEEGSVLLQEEVVESVAVEDVEGASPSASLDTYKLTKSGETAFYQVIGSYQDIIDKTAVYSGMVVANVKIGYAEVKDLVTENLLVKENLRVLGKSIFESSVSFLGPVNFINTTIFTADTDFLGDIRFFGRPIFNKDTAGTAVILKDTDKTVVRFEKEYDLAPKVNLTISVSDIGDEVVQKQVEDTILAGNLNFLATKINTKGFEIRLNKEAPIDITFSWTALTTSEADATAILDLTPTVEKPEVELVETSDAEPVEEVLGDQDLEGVEVASKSAEITIEETVEEVVEEAEIEEVDEVSALGSLEVIENKLGFLRLRESYTADSNELAQIPVGETLEYTAEEVGWYKVNYDGKEGWVSGIFVETN